MRMSTAVIGKPNGILQFSSPSPPREAGKFLSLLGICRPQASSLLGHPSPRQVRKVVDIPSVSHLRQEIRDQSKLTPTTSLA